MFLLHVDWRQLTLGHHRRLVQETDTLVYVEVVVILGRGWGGPHLSTHSHVSKLHYTQALSRQLHSTTLHSTTLHSTTLHVSYTPRQLHSTSATLHYTTLHYTTLHYTTLHYTTLHYTTLHYTTRWLHTGYTLHCTALHCTALHCTALQHTTRHTGTVFYRLKSTLNLTKYLKDLYCFNFINKLRRFSQIDNINMMVQPDKALIPIWFAQLVDQIKLIRYIYYIYV